MLFNNTMIEFDTPKILPAILTRNQCNLLNNWVLNNYTTDIFQTGKVANNRRTTRFTKNVEYQYPTLIVETFHKIKEKLKLLNCENIPQGNDGIICAISFNESKLENHVDPKYDNTESLHLIIQTASGEIGGDLIINDIIYKLNDGDCVYFLASKYPHKTNRLLSTTHRIVWINGVKIKI